MTIWARNPGLRRLLVAQVPADFADWLGYMAFTSLLAFVWQAPAVAFAWFGLALGLPYLVVGPFAGALVDRWPLRPVLVLSNLGRGLGALAMLLAPSWPWLVVIVALIGTVDSFFTPAKQAAIQALVAEEDRMAANGLSGAINQSSKVLGPALGGVLLALIGVEAIFVLSALVSAAAAALLIGLPLPDREAGPGTTPSLLREIGAGLRLLAQTPVLRVNIGISAALFFTMFLYDTFFPKLFDELGLGPRLFGLAIGGVGFGAVLGSLAAGRLVRARPFLWVGGAIFLNGFGIGALGATGQDWLAIAPAALVALFAAIGFTGAFVQVPLRTAMQNGAPPGTLARVTALGEAASMGALLVAPFLGAVLAASLGVGAPFLAGAALACLLGGATLLATRRLA